MVELKNTQRDPFYDFVKGVLIIIVVWGHFCRNSSLCQEFDRFWSYILLFEMPLFIFLSGLFQKPCSTWTEYKKGILKSVHRLFIPLLFWTFINNIVGSIMALDYEILFNIGSIFVFWYLCCLFAYIVLFKTTSLISSKIHINLSICLGIICVLFLFLRLPVYIPFLFVFFIAGFYYMKYKKDLERLEKKSYFFVLLTLLGVSVGLAGFNFTFQDSFYVVDNCIINNYEKLPFVLGRHILCLSASIFVFYVLKILYSYIKDKVIGIWLCKIGMQTLFIYVSHMVLLNQLYRPFIVYITNGKGVTISPFVRDYILSIILTFSLVYLLSLSYSFLKKNKITRYFMLGEK